MMKFVIVSRKKSKKNSSVHRRTIMYAMVIMFSLWRDNRYTSAYMIVRRGFPE